MDLPDIWGGWGELGGHPPHPPVLSKNFGRTPATGRKDKQTEIILILTLIIARGIVVTDLSNNLLR